MTKPVYLISFNVNSIFPSILELKCYHLHHGNPYLKLGPFSLEEKTINPFIVLFKNILTKNEITHFKDIAKNHLTRSSYGNDVQEAGTKKKKGGVFRTSKQPCYMTGLILYQILIWIQVLIQVRSLKFSQF